MVGFLGYRVQHASDVGKYRGGVLESNLLLIRYPDPLILSFNKGTLK